MIQLSFTTETQTVALAEPVTIKPGHGVPVTLTFDVAPNSVSNMQLALVDGAAPRNLYAFIDVGGWSMESSTLYTATLDVSGALVTYMSGKNSAALSLQLTAEIDGVVQDYPDLAIAVQPQGIPSDPSGAPGDLFYTEAQVDALLAPLKPAGNQAEIDVDAAVAAAALFSVTGFALIAGKIVAAAGSAAYSANYTLPVAGMVTGAIAEVNVELPASVNPTINIFNSTTGGTLLATVTNAAPGAPAFWYGRFRFDGTVWHPLFRALQI